MVECINGQTNPCVLQSCSSLARKSESTSCSHTFGTIVGHESTCVHWHVCSVFVCVQAFHNDDNMPPRLPPPPPSLPPSPSPAHNCNSTHHSLKQQTTTKASTATCLFYLFFYQPVSSKKQHAATMRIHTYVHVYIYIYNTIGCFCHLAFPGRSRMCCRLEGGGKSLSTNLLWRLSKTETSIIYLPIDGTTSPWFDHPLYQTFREA